MTRFRLTPTATQEQQLLTHCAHARYVWNLAVEQQSWWTPRRGKAPNFAAQSRQLTEARAAFGWLRAGSVTVQQQALRDFDQAMRNFFGGTHRKPTWRKAGQHEGFRIVAVQPEHVRRLSRKVGEVFVPKAGWVRFRWSRAAVGARSFRVTRDRSGRWHVAFAAIPDAIPAPGTGEVVGVDRGVAASAALSTGELLRCPGLSPKESERLLRLQRKLSKVKRGSNRRAGVKLQIATLKATQVDRRKDWVEKASTDLARRFDVIRFEDLRIGNMTKSAKGTVEEPGTNVRAKADLNRGILANGWGLLLQRTQDKAPGRVELVNPAYTSQTCNRCGHREAENRESQAVFACRACGHRDHADVNAARNIAAGLAVTARGGVGLPKPVNREPQLAAHAA
jgi:putative transposase